MQAGLYFLIKDAAFVVQFLVINSRSPCWHIDGTDLKQIEVDKARIEMAC